MRNWFNSVKQGLKEWWRIWRWVIYTFTFALVTIFAFPYLPDRYDPTAPIDLTEERTFVTPLKFRMMAQSYSACVEAVERAGVRVAAHSISSNERGCGMDEGLVLNRSRYPYEGPVRLTCPMMAALTQWEIHVVAPAAQKHLGTDVSSIVHYGTYSCRNVNGLATGRRSAHATANAIDIAGFRLEDGRTVSLLENWDSGDARAAFLRDVRDGSCDMFRTVLSPDYNARHKDHFHFEMGRWGICR